MKCCRHCGEQLNEDALYCRNCGKPINGEHYDNRKLSGGKLKALVAVFVAVVLVTTVTLVCTPVSMKLDNNTADSNTSRQNPFVALKGSFTDQPVTDEESARSAIESVAESIGVQDVDTELVNCREDMALGNLYYRFSQEYEGIPVYGRDMIITADKNGKVLLLSGNYMNLGKINTTPEIQEEDILAVVNDIVSNDYNIINQELVIYLLNCSPVLSWKVDILSSESIERYFISADEGIMIAKENLACNIQELCNGIDIEDEPKEFYAEYEDGKYELKDTSRNITVFDAEERTFYPVIYIQDSAGSFYYMTPDGITDKNGNQIYLSGNNGSMIIRDQYNNAIGMEGKITSVQCGLKDEDGWTGIESVTSESSTWNNKKAVTCYTKATLVYDYWMEQFSRKSFDNNNGELIYVYNDLRDGDDTINATSYGIADGNDNWMHTTIISIGKDMSLSTDTFAHEFTHAIDRFTCDLSGNNESASLKEALADVFTLAIQDWEEGICDWEVAGMRNIISPSADGLPMVYNGENWVDYADTANDPIHRNSTVISHTAYLMASGGYGNYKVLSMEEIADLFYETMYILPSDCDFSEFRSLMECMAEIQHDQEKLDAGQVACVTAAFDRVQIPRSPLPTSQEFEIDVYDYKGEPYDDYTLYLSYGADEKEYAGSEVNGGKIKIAENGVYGILIIDNADPDIQTQFTVEIVEQGGTDAIPVFLSSGFKEDFAGLIPSATPEPTPDSLPQQQFDEEAAYKIFISEGKYQEFTSGWFAEPDSYAFLDIDQDGVEELLLNAPHGDDFSTVGIFSYDGQAVNYVGKADYCYDLNYSSQYRALAFYDTRPSANSTSLGFWILKDGILSKDFEISWGIYCDVLDSTDPAITQYTDGLVSVVFNPISAYNGDNEATENKIELSGYLNSFSSLQNYLQGEVGTESGDYEEYRLAENGNLQYARYPGSQLVDYIIMSAETPYQIYGIYVGQDINAAQTILSNAGWTITINQSSNAEYTSGNSNIAFHWDNTNKITLLTYSTSISESDSSVSAQDSIVGTWEIQYEGETVRLQFTDDGRAISYEPDGYGGYDENPAYYRIDESNGILQIMDEYGEELEEPWYYTIDGDRLTLIVGRKHDIIREFYKV